MQGEGSTSPPRGEGTDYSALSRASVMSLNALPETLMNPIYCFVSRDIPEARSTPSRLLNQAKLFLPNPVRRGCPRPIGRIQRYPTVGGANGTTMVVMFVG